MLETKREPTMQRTVEVKALPYDRVPVADRRPMPCKYGWVGAVGTRSDLVDALEKTRLFVWCCE
jgi:hypothetical protein